MTRHLGWKIKERKTIRVKEYKDKCKDKCKDRCRDRSKDRCRINADIDLKIDVGINADIDLKIDAGIDAEMDVGIDVMANHVVVIHGMIIILDAISRQYVMIIHID